MTGVVRKAGEGEVLFDGRIVIRISLPELCITESRFATARPGAGPHLHQHHADSFYVLEGELAVLVRDEERLLGPGASAYLPAGVVHGFRTTTPARFLNLHTPDGGFADNLRSLDAGGPGGFDSVDASVGTGLPASHAVLAEPGEMLETPELSLSELVLEPRAGQEHVNAFYVLEGEATVLGEDSLVLGAGSVAAAPPGIAWAVSGGATGSRLLAILTGSR